jgi:hypothetical protein
MASLRTLERAIEVAQAIGALESNWYGHPRPIRYPRDVTALVQAGLGLDVVRIPALTADKVLHYLRVASGYDPGEEYEAPYGHSAPGPVPTLLYIGPPQSLLFVESNLPASLANYSLAREIGYYIAAVFDVWDLWQTSLPTQVRSIADAVDWTLPDTGLQLRGLLRHLPGCAPPDGWAGRATRRAELQGDIIARELLSPWGQVAAIHGPGGMGANRTDMVRLLVERYGLPALVAATYCDDLQSAQHLPPPAPWTRPQPFPAPHESQPLAGDGLPGLNLSDCNSAEDDEPGF